jgi:LuxR family transcriptional regulator, maltose regulon positive regulatory protein
VVDRLPLVSIGENESGPRDTVARERLTDRLRGAHTEAVLLHAPAGYGKSVLLAQWARTDPRPFAWVSLTEAHDDPAILLTAIADAFEPIEPIEPTVIDTIQTSRPNLDVIVPRLERALRERRVAAVLVLDELEHLESPASLRLIEALLGGVGGDSRLALATRAVPPIHVSRLRAEGRLTVLETRDLMMTPGEARCLLAAAGVAVDDAEVETIVARTEGWPVALYLAGMTRGEDAEASLPDGGFGGDERNLVDYMRDELLASLTPDDVDFLTRVSFLDRLGGELCDFVLETDGSGARLAELARRNMLLVPLDRRDEWFRFHSLLADMLRAELGRRHGGEVAALHLRASRWAEEDGDPERAVDFAIAAGDFGRAGRLIWEAVPSFKSTGRHATVQRWIERIGLDRAARDPHLSLTLAHGHLADGDGGEAEYWAAIAGTHLDAPEGLAADVPAGLAIIDATLARGGTAAMATAAELARTALPEESRWGAMADLLAGVAAHLGGDREAAHRTLSDAARRAAVWNVPLVQILALSQLALLAAADDDWPTARILASQARAGVDRAGLIARPSIALPMAVSAYVNAAEQRRADALADAAAARALLARVRGFGAWFEVETTAALAAATAELNEPVVASQFLASARLLLAGLPDAPMVAAWLAEIDAAVARRSGSALADLTPAELRVLRLLPSHLSYRQIADELIVSPNTVKTQVRSAYLKLGVSSRHEAVEICRDALSPDRGDSPSPPRQ